MSQTKFSLFISTAPGMEKTRAIPWSAGLGRRFGAFFFPSDEGAFLPPSTTAAALGKHVEEWRERARLGGWAVDSWDHVKAGAA